MRGKKLSAFVAMALIGASTAGAAQSASRPAAPEPAVESLGTADGSAFDEATTIGALFALLAVVILIWAKGNDKAAAPLPTSP
jgi:hypothetical protein